MKAIVMTVPGTPEVLQLQDMPKPTIQSPTEILVRLKAAGINPIDTKIRSRGTFYNDPMPAILGCDGAGIIEAIGSQVQDFKVGDEVYFCAGGLGKTGTGNYAEYAVVEEHCLAPKPISISFAEAAAAPLVLITAWESLYDRGRLEPGQTVLIHGGSGGVGHVAIQLAKIKGAKICTTVGNVEKVQFVRQLGIDYPVIYPYTDFVDAILNWTQGQGVDLAFDTVGGTTFYNTISVVKVYGDLVTILEPNSAYGSLKLARQRNLRISLELMLTPMLQGLVDAQKHQRDILKQCATWIDAGKLKIHLHQTFSLEKAAEAHQKLVKGGMIGKLALTI